MKGLTLALVVLTSGLAAGQEVRQAPPRPGLSWSEADSLGRKLATFEQRIKHRAGKAQTMAVTQSEINSYLNLSYAAQMPKGVSDVDVRLGRERIEARGWVDIDQYRDRLVLPTWSPLGFIGGRVPVDLAGKFVNAEDGFGAIEWESVSVASFRMPIRMLEQFVSSATRTERRPEGVDIHAPFRLPYRVQKIRLEPGQAIVVF